MWGTCCVASEGVEYLEDHTTLTPSITLTLLELQSHFGDKPLKFQGVCPQNGTAVLKEVIPTTVKSKRIAPLQTVGRGE